MNRLGQAGLGATWALVAASLFVGACATESTSRQDAAESAARAFLQSIDKGRYSETWSDCAEVMREKIESDDWANYVANTREPLGAAKHREFSTIEFLDSLDEMPDGDYALVAFKGSFEKGGSVEEVVGLALENDSSWRVLGYYTH